MTNPRLNHALSSISHILSHKRTIKKCSFAFREQIHHWWSYYIPVIGSWGKTEGGINILIHGQHSNFLLRWKIIYIYVYIFFHSVHRNFFFKRNNHFCNIYPTNSYWAWARTVQRPSSIRAMTWWRETQILWGYKQSLFIL